LNRVSVFPQVGLDSNPSIYVSCIPGMTGTHHHTQLCWLRWGHMNFLLKLAWNCSPPGFLPPWIARITGVSHHVWPQQKLLCSVYNVSDTVVSKINNSILLLQALRLTAVRQNAPWLVLQDRQEAIVLSKDTRWADEGGWKVSQTQTDLQGKEDSALQSNRGCIPKLTCVLPTSTGLKNSAHQCPCVMCLMHFWKKKKALAIYSLWRPWKHSPQSTKFPGGWWQGGQRCSRCWGRTVGVMGQWHQQCLDQTLQDAGRAVPSMPQGPLCKGTPETALKTSGMQEPQRGMLKIDCGQR
jgi:hypothetical protein